MSLFGQWAGYLAALSQELPASVLHKITRFGNEGYVPPPRLIPAPSRSGYTPSFDDTRIYWELHGPEPVAGGPLPVVFCYGLVCSMNQWRHQLERYAKERPCVLLDYRGHHQSDFPAEASRMNMSALAKDVSCVMTHLGIETAHVWGHSLGVDVALELAAAEPEKCRSLILLCGTVRNPFKDMFNAPYLEKIMGPLLTAYPTKAEVFNTVWKLAQTRPELTVLGARLLGFNMHASSLRDVETYAHSVVSVDPRTFFLLLRELSKGMTEALLTKIRTPTLVMAGSKDPITPSKAMEDFASRLPNGVFVEIPAGSHNAQLDFGDYVSMKAEEFWRARKLD